MRARSWMKPATTAILKAATDVRRDAKRKDQHHRPPRPRATAAWVRSADNRHHAPCRKRSASRNAARRISHLHPHPQHQRQAQTPRLHNHRCPLLVWATNAARVAAIRSALCKISPAKRPTTRHAFAASIPIRPKRFPLPPRHPSHAVTIVWIPANNATRVSATILPERRTDRVAPATSMIPRASPPCPGSIGNSAVAGLRAETAW